MKPCRIAVGWITGAGIAAGADGSAAGVVSAGVAGVGWVGAAVVAAGVAPAGAEVEVETCWTKGSFALKRPNETS